MDRELREKILGFQRNEITEYHVYEALSEKADEKNSRY